MMYQEIEKNMPEEHESQRMINYRYPRGESYLDVIQRFAFLTR
ncbi:putative 6-phosphofructo-2-kinase, Fructose-2,6-bisphosphate 2-phosphatase [Helianthus annuus]|nr:putative 6-phosphofructo-2-kinase, Fructose-2,6-bisphosphate 2-phosphatase [Helianthus annuus]